MSDIHNDTKTFKRRSPGIASIGCLLIFAAMPLEVHGAQQVLNRRVRGRQLSSPSLSPIHREQPRSLNIFDAQQDVLPLPHGDLPQPLAPPHDAVTEKGLNGKGLTGDGPLHDGPPHDPLAVKGKGKGGIGSETGDGILDSPMNDPITGLPKGKGLGKGLGKGKGKGKGYSGPPTRSPAPSASSSPTGSPGSNDPSDGIPTDGDGSGTGGSPTDGGDNGTGGSPTDGGDNGTGGSPTDGGDNGTGGSPTDGGDNGTGGSPTDGGDNGTGGSPTDGGDGSGTGGSPTDGVLVRLDCDAIREGTAPIENDPLSYSVSLDISIRQGFDINSVMDVLQTKLQEIVAPAVAGCPPSARRLMEQVRRLQSGIYNVVFGKGEVGGTCTPTVQSGAVPEGAQCYETDQNVRVYVNEGAQTDGLEDKIEEEINKMDISVPGLLNIGDAEVVRDPTATGGTSGIAGTSDRLEDDDGIGPIGWTSMAVGALALLLLLLLFAKAKESRSTVEHVYLDDDDSEYMKEIDNETVVESDLNSPSRTYLMEETDGSIASAWGLDSKLRSPNYGQLGKAHSTMDVHNCSSATCHICAERNRNRDLEFVPTGPPPSSPAGAPKMPSRSVREYIASDTVDL